MGCSVDVFAVLLFIGHSKALLDIKTFSIYSEIVMCSGTVNAAIKLRVILINNKKTCNLLSYENHNSRFAFNLSENNCVLKLHELFQIKIMHLYFVFLLID